MSEGEITMECLRNTILYPVSLNPKKGITYTWILIMLLVVAFFFAACFMASQLHKGWASDQAAGFAAVWSSLAAVGGTIPVHFSLYSLHFISLPFPSLPFPSLPFTSLHFTSLPFTSLPFTPPSTSLHFTPFTLPLHSTSLHFTSLHFTSLRYLI